MKNHILLSQTKVKYGSLKMRFPGEKSNISFEGSMDHIEEILDMVGMNFVVKRNPAQ
jgi:hypothetical protein